MRFLFLLISFAFGINATRAASANLAIAYSSYLGGKYDDGAGGVAVDKNGNAYIAGTAQSPNFPTSAGAVGAFSGEQGAFVAKFDPNGALIYSTFIAEICEGEAHAIAVDAEGNAYITGRVGSCILRGGPSPGVLVAKLDPAGTPVYVFVFGERFGDTSEGNAIAIDAAGNAYITGTTSAGSPDFPTTPGAFQTNSCDGLFTDGFVAKINPTGTGLVYCTFLCGTSRDLPKAIAVDGAGNVYVGGGTTSKDFPMVNAFQSNHLGDVFTYEGFVSKLNPEGSKLEYSTYFEGRFGDTAVFAIAVDAQGNAFAAGDSTGGTLPTTPGVVQATAPFPSCPGGICSDAFVAKFSPTGALIYSTLIAGEADDTPEAIALDGNGDVWIAGTTSSLYYPVKGAFQREAASSDNAFVTKLSADASRILYSSYLSGGKNTNATNTTSTPEPFNEAAGIALDPNGNVYLSGYTSSLKFPTTPGVFQTEPGGNFCLLSLLTCGDAFITKLRTNGPAITPAVSVQASSSEVLPGASVTITWAGVPNASTNDRISVLRLGEAGHSINILATYPTTGVEAGSVDVSLPILPAGTYEFRFFGMDPDSPALLKGIARTDPVMVLDTLRFEAAIDGGGIFHLRVSGLAAGNYNVVANETLGNNWQVVGRLEVPAENAAEFSEAIKGSSVARFYRLSR